MGGDDDLRVGEQRVVGRRGFLFHHVGPVAGEAAGIEGFQDGGGVGEFAAAGVHDVGAFGHQREALAVDEVMGVGVELGVRADDVDRGEERLDGIVADHPVLGRDVFRPVVAEAVDLHVEAVGAAGHFLADAAHADQADALAPQLVAGDAEPLALAGRVDCFDQVLLHGEQQAEGVLGDGGVVDAGGEEDGNAELLGGRDVDLVEADAVFRDHPEAGQAFFDDRAGDRVVAAEEGVEVAGELQHPGLAQRAALADDFEALAFQLGVVGAGSVLEAAGGEENAGGHGR